MFETPIKPYFVFENRRFYLCDFEPHSHALWNARGAFDSISDIFLKLIDGKKPQAIIGIMEKNQ